MVLSSATLAAMVFTILIHCVEKLSEEEVTALFFRSRKGPMRIATSGLTSSIFFSRSSNGSARKIKLPITTYDINSHYPPVLTLSVVV